MLRRAYRFRLEPDDRQAIQLAQFAGACRWVWNQALVEQKCRLEFGQRTAGYAEMCRWITAWRHNPDTSWLYDVHVHVLQQKLKDLARAFDDYFRKAQDPLQRGFPYFKKRGDGDRFRYPINIKAEIGTDGWGRVWLPKIGWVRYRASRQLEGTIAQATVMRDGDNWFVSIQTEREAPEPATSLLAPVGLDLGIARFATLSDGTVIEPLNRFSRSRQRIARCQKQLARKKKGSRNRAKQRRRLAALHRKVRRARQDFLHQVSTAIARRYGLVAMERLSVRRLSASARGTIDAPGRNVKAKAGLNRSILDQGWYKFRVLLDYKLAERGGQLILVEPKYTSQRCAACGHIEADNRKSQTVFLCLSCGHRAHADLNASTNILTAAGHAVEACGGIGHGPPIEAGTCREAG